MMANGWRKHGRATLAVVLCELLVLLPGLGAATQGKTEPQRKEAAASQAVEPLPLQAYLLKSYLDLFQVSPELHFSAAAFEAEKKRLDQNKDQCVNRYKKKADAYKDEINAAKKKLKQKGVSSAERHDLHCRIQDLEVEQSQENLLAHQGIPVVYQNMEAKLALIQNWPAAYQQIEHDLSDGAYRQRRWGDVKDIGFRTIAKGQADDIKTGRDAIQQMKQQGILPPEVKNKAIVAYVTKVAQRVAAHSDLRVPLHVYVLNSKEINAFALPGGYLFIERGLLQAADDESELAGVIGHEIGHVVARHGHKLMERATIASLIYQAAQIAAIVATGGVAGIGTYYAIQYGFYGLGMMMDLKLLGVSRAYELQADQLGIQYAWNAGYDPTGFIRFFDKMATQVGYVQGVSWFRDHPPFYERMVDSEREILFLPKKPSYVVQTSAFEQMKRELAPVVAKAKKVKLNKPSLLEKEPGCKMPAQIQYKPGENVDNLCGSSQPAGNGPVKAAAGGHKPATR